MRLILISTLASLLFATGMATAEPPGILNHQGRIAVDGINYDGTGWFKFALVDATASETYWTNDGTGVGTPGSPPGSAVSVTVIKGHYAVRLGDSPMTAILAAVFANNSDVRLRVWFSTDNAAFEHFIPDRRVTSSGYALSAASVGAVPLSGLAKLNVDNTAADGIAVSGTFGAGSIAVEGAGTLLLWYPGKSSIRAGTVTGDEWSDVNVGSYSTAFGFNAIASGEFATAFGDDARATGGHSTAFGWDTEAVGEQSTAFGNLNFARGNHSTAMGIGTTAHSFGETTVGIFSSDYTPASLTSPVPSDRLFVIGSGESLGSRANAVTVLKSGAVGIGTSNPAHRLDVAGIVNASGFLGPLDGASLTSGSVTSAAIANNAVTTSKLTDDAVTASKLAGGAVRTAAIANDAVTASKLADGAVNGLDSSNGSLTDVVQVDGQGRVAIGTSSNPNEIVPKDSEMIRGGDPRSVAVQGDFAYAVDAVDALLQIFDVSNPDAITARGFLGVVGAPTSVAVQGKYAYVTYGDELRIFDVSDPDMILPKDWENGPGLDKPLSVAVQGNYAYVVDRHDLWIFDVSDPNAIVPKGVNGTGLGDPRAVAVQGNYAYVVNGDGAGPGALHIFDVSNPNMIVPKDFDGTGLQEAVAVAVQGSHAYVVDVGPENHVLQIFDVSDPDAIVPKDSDGTGLEQNVPRSVAVFGNYAYVVSHPDHPPGGGLGIFDVSNPNAIAARDSDRTGLDRPVSVAVQGNYAYVVDEFTDLLQIFEVAPSVAVDGRMQLTSGGLMFADGSVQTRAFGVDTIFAEDICANAVTANSIAPGAVGGSEIDDGSITGDDIADGAVGSSEIADDSITGDDIAAGAVGGSEIADGSITGADIAIGGITGAGIAKSTLTGDHIADGSIRPADLNAIIGRWEAFGTGVRRGKGSVSIGTTENSHSLVVANRSADDVLRLIGPDSSGSGARLNFGGADHVYLDEPHDDGLTIQANEVGIGGDPSASGQQLQVFGNASKTTAGDWLANSDRRIKRDIRPLDNALEVIRKLRPVGFRYTREWRAAHPEIEDVEYFNVIAQEFAEVFPDAVRESGERLPNGEPVLQVDTYPAQVHAIAAIAELDAKLEAANKRLEEMEKRTAEMEQLNAEQERVNSEMKRGLEALEERLAELLARERAK